MPQDLEAIERTIQRIQDGLRVTDEEQDALCYFASRALRVELAMEEYQIEVNVAENEWGAFGGGHSGYADHPFAAVLALADKLEATNPEETDAQ